VNPGLEIIDTSIVVTNPWDAFQLHHIPGWFNPGFTSTDYFNSDGKHSNVGSRYFNYEIKAHTGNSYAGIYIDNTKWKEYVGVELTEPLIAGKNYRLEMYLAVSRKAKLAMSTLQVVFGDTRDTSGFISEKPTNLTASKTFQPITIQNTGGTGMVDNWTKVSVDFTAIGGEKVFMMGYVDDYFKTNEMPVTKFNKGNDPYTFYFIDDLSLVQIDGPPITRKTVTRPIIYFDVNKSTIKPEYFGPLDDVVDRMKKNARMRIEVNGYTDADASDSFNIKLSQKRAQAVADYIISKGIDPKRITVKWFDEQVQISDEKALNRRVEFRYFEN
jgi:outer membrane protein OmpA-like peptidoglycan-associated protein